jgi:hypothetical protein
MMMPPYALQVGALANSSPLLRRVVILQTPSKRMISNDHFRIFSILLLEHTPGQISPRPAMKGYYHGF